MILDTNALSDWLANESAISELISALEEPPILTYVTLAEYRYGIAGSRYRVKIATQLKRLESYHYQQCFLGVFLFPYRLSMLIQVQHFSVASP